MKCRSIFLKSIIVFSFILAVQTGFAQLSIGPKAGYNSFQETFGMGGQIAIVSGNLRTSADFIKHLNYHTLNSATVHPMVIETNTNRDFHELNLNFSYLLKTDKAYFYPLVGVNIAYYKKSVAVFHKQNLNYSAVSNNSETKSEMGINLGAGAQYNLGFISPFIEAKYSISDICNGSIGAGLLFNFGRGKKQE